MNADGSGLKRLTRTRSDFETLGDNGMPVWSPDGKRIVFVSNRAGSGDIWTMRADGSGIRKLFGLPGRDEASPAFTPDGSQLAFSSMRLGKAVLYVMQSDGTGARKVADGEEPSWRGSAS